MGGYGRLGQSSLSGNPPQYDGQHLGGGEASPEDRASSHALLTEQIILTKGENVLLSSFSRIKMEFGRAQGDGTLTLQQLFQLPLLAP